MATTDFYDLFLKKPATFPDAETAGSIPSAPGAAGLRVALPTAQALKRHVRAHGGTAVVYPASYRTPKLTYLQAQAVAQTAYEMLTQQDPANYGPLELYVETPVYWFFSADNYRLQAEGYAPGRNAFPVDKLTGELLDEAELKNRFSSLQGAG